MAQLTSAGTATLKLRPSLGSHSYKAVFLGTKAYAGSASGTSAALIVTGLYPTVTSMQASCCTSPYTLTASVSSSAATAPGPTGQLSLIDTTSGNAVVTALPLGNATVGPALVNASNVPAGNQPTGIVAGDFNGDGNLDLALGLNDPSQPLAVLLGNGAGNFTAAPVSSITATGTPVLVQDFNGDGIPDILLSDENGGAVTVLLGNGDGTFREAPGNPTESNFGAYPVVAADFNGDGIPDLAIAGGYYLVVLLGNGDGSFTQVPMEPSSTEVDFNSMVVGDFNEDGIPDLAGLSGQTLSIYLGNGDGTFTLGTGVTPSGGLPNALATADFNGDGKLDLAVALVAGENVSLTVFPGKGDGTFGAALGTSIAVEDSANRLNVGDFNGDGVADLFAGAQVSGPTVNILLGGGNGTFSQMPTGSAVLPCCSNSILGDFNNDGLTDIASSSVYDGTEQLLVPQFTEATATASGINPPGPGTQQVEASYPGDSNFTGSVSGTVPMMPALATPQISPKPGTYTTEQTIKITEATPSATIYYSAYGIVNTNGYVVYSGPIVLTTGGGETIEYYASETGYQGTDEISAAYVLNLPTAPAPTFSLAAGTYASTQMLTISDTVAGAAIYYTTNGTFPGLYSTPYTGKIAISSSAVVSAVAIAPGFSLSPATAATYLVASSSTPYIYTVAGTEGTGFSGDGGPATFALLNEPASLAEDSQGNLYIADENNNVVRRVATGTGAISTVAGTGVAGYIGDGSAATNSELNSPQSLAFDASGNLYIADSGNCVMRKVTAATGDITTVAGNGTCSESGDNGPATGAEIDYPDGVALDASGNLYISEAEGNRVRKVAAGTGTITTYAGGGTGLSYGNIGDGGPATSATLFDPRGLALDSKGNLYIADSEDEVIREVNVTTGIISTVAGHFTGIGDGGYIGDGGPATSASLYYPTDVAVDATGNLYIADYYNNVIRKVTASTGDIATLAGNGGFCSGEGGDGGPAADAALCEPEGISLDASGDVYVAEQEGSIRKVTLSMQPPAAATATPTFSAQAGSYAGPQTVTIADATPGAEIYLTLDGTTPSTSGAGYRAPIDVNGSVTLKAVAVAPGHSPSAMVTAAYTVSTPPPAVVSTVAGSGTGLPSSAGQPALETSLSEPSDVKTDTAGDLYIADAANDVVWQIAAATGTATVVAGNLQSPGSGGDGGPATSARLDEPDHVALDRNDNLYISDSSNHLVRMVTTATGIISTYAGSITATTLGDGGPATSAQIEPAGMAFDSAGNLYIADIISDRIRIVDANTGIISTVAGGGPSPGPSEGDGGPATSASLVEPFDVALDAQGDLYIADDGAARVRKVTAATGIISTIAGNGDRGSSGDGLPATEAEADPYGLAVDAAGDLYISNFGVLRELAAGATTLTTVAGTGYYGYSGDGGSPTLANFCGLEGITLDSAGNLFVADECDQRIRKLTFSSSAALPTFSVAPGTYALAQSVAIADTTPAATIYYTTNGSTPSTNSNAYSTPVVVSNSETLKAMAVAGGYANSSIAAAAYTIGMVTPTVTVTSSSTSITPVDALSVTVTVNGGSGNPTPTGTVTLTSGSYASAAISLAGGDATIVIPAGTLSLGTDTLTATYAPDTSGAADYDMATGSGSVIVSTITPTMTVTPSAASITTTQALSVAIVVSGGSGNPTPTGTVTLVSGSYSSQQTLASGSAAFTVAAGALPAGTDTLTATYAPDSAASGTYTTVTQTTTVAVSVPIGTDVASVTVTPASTDVTNAQPLSVAVSVAGASGQPTPTGSVTLTVASFSAQQTLVSGAATFDVHSGTLTTGSDTITASYSGDANYAVASGTAAITVAQVLITSQTASAVSPGGSTTAALTLAASNSYSGTMNLTCALTSSPSGAQSLPTCNLKPTSVGLTSGGSGTSTLTVNTTAASTSAVLHPLRAPLHWLGGGGATLAALLLWGIPARRRRWVSMLAVLLLMVAAVATGCGGGGKPGGGGGGQSIPATTAGNYTFTVTGVDSVNPQITTSTTVVVTVQ
jgi:sugar lactone lactonase YvrE